MKTDGEARSLAHDGSGLDPSTPAFRNELLDETDRYLAELIDEVGEPSPEEVAEAEAWCNRIEHHLRGRLARDEHGRS